MPFWFAAHGAGCRPCELVHIGDDEVTDLQGALAAGCRAILISRPNASRDINNANPPGTKVDAAEAPERPPADPARWREVASLDEAVAVVLEWQREGGAPPAVPVS